jgi:hypothetical protein
MAIGLLVARIGPKFGHRIAYIRGHKRAGAKRGRRLCNILGQIMAIGVLYRKFRATKR